MRSSSSAMSRWSSALRRGRRVLAVELDAQAQARQRRAQLVRRVGEQEPVGADELLDPRRRAVEARGEPRHLVASADRDPGREVAGAERLDTLLQPLDPLGQPARHRIGENRDHQRGDERGRSPRRTTEGESAPARAPRSSVRPAGGSSRPAGRRREASRGSSARATGVPPRRSAPDRHRTARNRHAGVATIARSPAAGAVAAHRPAAARPRAARPRFRGRDCRAVPAGRAARTGRRSPPR